MSEPTMQEAVLAMRLHLAVNGLKLIHEGRFWSGRPMVTLDEARELAADILYGPSGLVGGEENGQEK
jgi:hypothetical protein